MLDLPEPKPSILDANLASALTDIGVYHGTALYHQGPDEIIDAYELAEQRWDNPLYQPFGGLYVSFSEKEAAWYANNLAEAVVTQIEGPQADISSVVYRIGLEAGCEVALDEDFIGWSDYVEHEAINFPRHFLRWLSPEDQAWLMGILNERAAETDDLWATALYKGVSRRYVLDVLRAYALSPHEPEERVTWRILNDRWHIIEAEEVV